MSCCPQLPSPQPPRPSPASLHPPTINFPPSSPSPSPTLTSTLPPAPACSAPAQTAVLVKQLRAALEGLLEQKVRKPRLALEEVGGQVIQSIVDLLNHEEAAREWGVR